MSDHERTLNNLSTRMSIYRGHHEEKEKRFSATQNCLIEKQRQETLQLQQQILSKESKKKSNKTGPRPGARSTKKSSTPNAGSQPQSFVPEKVKQEAEDQHSTLVTLSQPHNLPNNHFANSQYQPESQAQHGPPQMTHHTHHQNHIYQHQPHQPPIQPPIPQPDHRNTQPNQFHQYQTPHNYHNQYAQPYQQSSLESQINSPPQAQPQPYQAHHEHYSPAQYVQPTHQQLHPHKPPLQHPHHVQRHQHPDPKFHYQPPMNGNYYPQEIKELNVDDLAYLDTFQNSAELPLAGFAPNYEQEIFLDQNFIEKFLDNI